MFTSGILSWSCNQRSAVNLKNRTFVIKLGTTCIYGRLFYLAARTEQHRAFEPIKIEVLPSPANAQRSSLSCTPSPLSLFVIASSTTHT